MIIVRFSGHSIQVCNIICNFIVISTAIVSTAIVSTAIVSTAIVSTAIVTAIVSLNDYRDNIDCCDTV